MNWISESDFTDELHHNAATKDLIKARVLIDHLSDVSPDLQRQVLSELDYCDPEFPAPLLGYLLALNSENLALSREDLQMVLGNVLQKEPVHLIDLLVDIGTREAIDALITRLGTDREIDQKILDALAIIQTEYALVKLIETLDAPEAHTRNHGKILLTKIGVPALPILTQNLEKNNTDTLIHTLNVLGTIGSEKSIRSIRNLLHNEPPDANVRFAAYEALGLLPVHKGAHILASGLTDPDGMVRVAAAKAIEKNLDNTFIAGLKNLTRPKSRDTKQVASALIDALADNVLLQLIDGPGFFTAMLDHLATEAHPDTRTHIESLLRRKGQSELADHIDAIAKKEDQTSGRLIYTVDDSRMILSLYKTALFQIGCDVHLFEFPERALEQIRQTKPDLVFTDLNMPGMTGIELTEAIRQHYPLDELPIIMVTTQSDGQDFSDAQKAGISTIIQKPFTPEILSQIISEFTRD